MFPSMYPGLYPKYAAYGSTFPILGSKPKESRARPALVALIGCLFVPFLLFILTFWLRSFEVRKDSEMLANALCYCLLLPVVAFAWMTFNLASNGDARPMAFLTTTALLAWILGFLTGGFNYTSFMRPYYDINNLNVYPSVDPSKYLGTQLMDAGMIQFTPGSGLRIDKSMGFKNEDVYCVAPIVANATAVQTTYDFWAVGINCCSGHRPDWHCGEYTNPHANWGLRLMDDSRRDFFRLAVKEASVTYNLNAPHPVFMYWLSDPASEVAAYQDDGFRFFMMWTFSYFALQLFLVLCSLVLHAKL